MNDLNRAIKYQNVFEVRRLLAAGSDVNAPDTTDANVLGETPLMVAASTGNTAVIRLLLEAGADMETASPGDWSPLARAAASASSAAVILLLQHGASPRAPFHGEQWLTSSGRTGPKTRTFAFKASLRLWGGPLASSPNVSSNRLMSDRGSITLNTSWAIASRRLVEEEPLLFLIS